MIRDSIFAFYTFMRTSKAKGTFSIKLAAFLAAGRSRIAILLILGTCLLLGAHELDSYQVEEFGIVTTDELNVQADPGEHGKLQKTLPRGSEVKIMSHRQGWLQILHNGDVGFIPDNTEFIKIVQREGAEPGGNSEQHAEDLKTQIDAVRKRAQHLSQEIEEGKEEVEAISRKETDIIERLNDVELALNKSRKRTSALKAEIKELDNQIDTASTSYGKLRAQVQTNQDYVSKRLIALFKMHRLGQFQLLAAAETIHEFIQRKEALERILAYDEKIYTTLMNQQAEIKMVLARLQSHRENKNLRAAEYNNHIQLMTQERSIRSRLLAEIRSQKALELAAIEVLSQSAKDLDQEIISLSNRIPSDEPGTAEKSAARLSFYDFKGLLMMPVNGRIVSLFGSYKNPKYNVMNFRSGIDISADKGEPIRSVFGGEVLYSRWFRGYGNMIIVDHGNKYYTVYAHLEEAFKSKGDNVETGEVIATAGDSGSLNGSKLHFEVRHHGKPLDPSKWLKKDD
jgi:septal ring factor EnvC (AmiA/AmiB activator)